MLLGSCLVEGKCCTNASKQLFVQCTLCAESVYMDRSTLQFLFKYNNTLLVPNCCSVLGTKFTAFVTNFPLRKTRMFLGTLQLSLSLIDPSCWLLQSIFDMSKFLNATFRIYDLLFWPLKRQLEHYFLNHGALLVLIYQVVHTHSIGGPY